MPLNINLQTLRTRALERADALNDANVDATLGGEVDAYINQSIRDLYDLLVRAAGDQYYSTNQDLTTVANQATLAFPDTFYKMLGMQWVRGDSTLQRLWPLQLQKFLRFTDDTGGWTRDGRVWYMIEDAGETSGNLRFYPTPTGAHTARIWYIQGFVALTTDAATFNSVNGWDELVVLDVAMKIKIKREESITDIMKTYVKKRADVQAMADTPNEGEPMRVLDVERGYPLPGEWWS